MITVGSQVFFIELEEMDRTKRFVLPNSENILQKAMTFAEGKEGIHMVRQGIATVASKIDEIPESLKTGFVSTPSAITEAFHLTFLDHPVLTQGEGRYSPELTGAIMQTELKPVEIPQIQSAPAAPEGDLTAILKQQINAKKEQENKDLAAKIQAGAEAKAAASTEKTDNESFMEKMESVPEAKPEAPTVPQERKTLSEFLAENKKEPNKPVTSVIHKTPPVSKIDRILEKIERIEISLGLQEEMEVADDKVRAEQLKDWFQSHVESVGIDRTFEILAGKIKL